jgi:hypothetical protein
MSGQSVHMTRRCRQSSYRRSVVLLGRDKQTYGDTSLFLFGVTSWLYVKLLLKTTNAAEQDNESTAVTVAINQHQADTEPAAIGMVQYPWEPTGTVTSDTIDDASPPRHSLIPSNSLPTRQAQQQQLEFLSNMTFANGGLRAPSCPCCQ